MRDSLYSQWIAEDVRHIVRDYVAHHSLTVPVPIYRLLHDENIPVVEKPMPRTFKAGFFRSRQGNTIIVNSNLSPFEQRFAVSHEAIHGYLHAKHLVKGAYREHSYSDEMETEANTGAAELLLPYAWFNERAHTVIADGLGSLVELDRFIATAEARRWAAAAQVTTSVLRYHLIDLGWVGTMHAVSTPPIISRNAVTL